MTGVDGIADGGVHWLQARCGHPAIVHHLDDGTERTFGDDSLLLIFHIIEEQLLLAVPSAEGTQSVGVAHPEAVVARTCLQLFLRRIELGVLYHQPLVHLAIEVDGLPVVEIDAHRHQVALEAYAMRMYIMVYILRLLVEGDAAQIDVLLVLGEFLVLARQTEFGESACRIVGLLAIGKQLDMIILGFLLAEVYQETELVVGAVAIGIVELRWYFLAIHRHHGSLDVAILADVDDHGFIGLGRFRWIRHGHIEVRLGLCRQSHERHQRQHHLLLEE